MVRWKATVWYRRKDYNVDVLHYLEELKDLHDVVESGPHWDTITRIEVMRVPLTKDNLTVEEAANL